jgi:hypothetical protein
MAKSIFIEGYFQDCVLYSQIQQFVLELQEYVNEFKKEVHSIYGTSYDDLNRPANTDAILEDILTDIKHHIDEVNEYEKYLKLLDKYNNTDDDLNDDEYWLLFNNNFLPIQEKKHIITHICFDDMIGDKQVFKKSRDGGLVKFLLKHRHLYTNVFITTQYINAIQPIIKNNIDVFCLFKYANLNDILKKFYPCVSGIMNEEQFKEIYTHSSKEKFNFLTIISHNALKGRLLIRKNWNINLQIS